MTTSTSTCPVLLGIHHVTLPVEDVEIVADWFSRVLGFDPCVMFEAEDHVTGALLEHPSGTALLLRAGPTRGALPWPHPAIAFAVADNELGRWDAHLTALGVSHTKPTAGHHGREIRVLGPSKVEFFLTTADPVDGAADDSDLTA